MKTVLLVDGGYLRAGVRTVNLIYNNDFIEQFCLNCFHEDEYRFRIFYYDAPLYRGKVTLPVSGRSYQFQSSDQWLDALAKKERFAVRRGAIGFRGWKPKTIPIAGRELQDQDFSPVFEQKGVDMRIGLDIATFAHARIIERIVLVSGDTDMVPAIKLASTAGIEVIIVQLPKPVLDLHASLLAHSDMVRSVVWPIQPAV